MTDGASSLLLYQGSHFANVAQLVQAPDRVAQATSARRAENRRDEIVSLRVDFGTRHRILGRATHRFHVMAQRRSVAQNDLDDALAARHCLGQHVVAMQLYFFPETPNS